MDKKLLAKLIAGIFGTAPFLSGISHPALAATTDIATSPLANRRSSDIKPNIMLVLDDSGSMLQDYMPDAAGNNDPYGPGYRSNLCNTIYYNPNPTNPSNPLSPYLTPRDETGTNLNNADPASFTAAYDNGYWSYDQVGQSSGTASRTDLSGDQGWGAAYPLNTSGFGAYYWSYRGTDAASVTPASAVCTLTSLGYGSFSTATGVCSGSTTPPYSDPYSLVTTVAPTDADCGAGKLIWSKTVVSASSSPSGGDETQRFANWYSYYRNRMEMVKSAIGRAFLPLVAKKKYRAGFITIAPNQLNGGITGNPSPAPDSAEQASVYSYDPSAPYNSKFLELRNFDTTDLSTNQPNRWFNILYSQRQNGSTPLREGLSRVGRYYAGKNDGPNAGMIPSNASDPVQYACEQNFTILTTDGYWDSPAGSIGGYKLDYTQAMDNQDGDITETDAYGQGLAIGARPVYDGGSAYTATTTDAYNQYQNIGCTYYLQSSTQILQSTSQNLQNTSQNLQGTVQKLQSTNQVLKTTVQDAYNTAQILSATSQVLRTETGNYQSTSQNLQSTAQVNQSTRQTLQGTNQNLKSTSQILQATTQLLEIHLQQLQSTNQYTQGTVQNLQTTAQVRGTTTQQLTSTNQYTKGTFQNLQTTAQVRGTTTQQLTSTNQYTKGTLQQNQTNTQIRQTTTQVLTSTLQNLVSTHQELGSTEEDFKSTLQILQCNGVGSGCAPKASCTPVVEVTVCSTVTTGPTARSSCTPTAASFGNSWTTTTCSTALTGPTGAASCTPVAASSGNGWVTTTCSTIDTGPTAASTCTPTSASAGNSWVTTTCTSSTTGPTAASTCTPVSASAGNSWVATTCSTSVSAPTGVSSCTATSASAGNSWMTTTCSTSTAGPGSVATCTATSASAGNSWIATTCTTSTTTNVPISACTATSASAGNAWTTTTCTTSTTGPTAIGATCTPVSASAGNSWVTTTCTTSTVGPTGQSSCSAVTASAGNSWIATTCSTSTAGPTGVSSCTATSASAGNSWITTTCTTSTTTNVPLSACTATSASAGNSWITTTCTTSTTGPTAIGATCTPVSASAGNSWVTTTCTTSTVGPTAQSSCSAVTASAGNSWIATTCSTSTAGPAGASSCTATSASSGNSWITTTCTTSTTTNVPISACAATSASAGNGWVTTTCTTSTAGPTAMASCANVSASAGNSWVTTTCVSSILSSTAVASCTPVSASAGNSWVTTLCSTGTTGGVGVSSCTAVAASAGNSWIATTCSTSTTTDVPSATCTATAASAGNSWVTTTCATSTTANVPLATCTATSASAGNTWITTTCTTTTTGPTSMASCTAVSASAGNSWVTTTCGTSTTTNVAIANCTATSASAGNSWMTTTCSSATTTNVNVGTCAATSASAGNSWVTTTCSAASSVNIAVSVCTPAAASAGNAWVTTTCTTTTTSPVAASSCTPVSASAGNNWVTTTCTTSTTGPTGIAVCTPVSASAGNSWVATTCAPTTVAAAPVASCTVTSASAGNSWITTTCATSTTASVPIAACTATSASAGNSWVTTTCASSVTTGVPIAACAATSASAGNGWVTTTCASSVTSNVPINTCTATSASAGNSWVTTTCGSSTTTNVPVASCTNTSASSGNAWVTTVCDTTSSPLNVAATAVQTCTTVAAAAGNSYVSTDCAPQSGSKDQYQTKTQSTDRRYSGTYVVGSTVNPWTGYSAWTDESLCLASPPALQANGQPSPTDPATPPYTSFDAACTGWPCVHINPASIGGSGNSLADVAQYYYKTDLRAAGTTGFNGADVSANIVPSSATDTTEGDMAKWQHMTTFTMGLGVSGTFAYNGSYKNKPVGTFTGGLPNDPFQQIRCQDSSNVPLADPNACRNWPTPVEHEPPPSLVDPNPATRVDDLWHAAVDGRGQYFSAADPDAVFTGLTTTLLAINSQSGAGTGATVSNQDPVPGNDMTFRAGFKTVDWTGDIRAQQLYTGTDLSLEGTTLPGVVWSAQNRLDGQVGSLCDNRNIYLPRMGASNNMVPFTWNSDTCTSGVPAGAPTTGLNAGEQAFFTSTGSGYTAPFPMVSWSQFIDMTDGSLSTVDQRALGQGANLVNFLRGQRGMENFSSGSATKLFRNRVHVLGDIINSQPRYVPPPAAEFTDVGFALFKTEHSSRPAMLYAGANDGMLHAFNAGTSVSDPTGGMEAWAVIPTTVLPNLYRLADTGYSENHAYFVDGPPTSGDVYDKHQAGCSGASDANVAKDCWKTILVGGLGDGGRAYYGLDVTDPASPKVLWEFKWSDTCYDAGDPATQYSDCHIGLTFGAPLITKLVDGTWVALVSSGLNNVNSPAKAGDGQGYLYVLDAITGQILQKVHIESSSGAADVGDATTPSGFSAINSYVENFVQDNTSLRVYGGDMLGNVWRVDLMRLTDPADPTTAQVHYDVVRLATLLDPSGVPQPITTTPQLMNIGAAKTPMVYVGTGRYLGESDLSDAQVQTVYGLAEDLSVHSDSAAYLARGNTVQPSTGLTLRQQLNQVVLSTVAGDPTTRQASTPTCAATAIDAANICAGWYADLPAAGERVTVDMRLVLGSLLVPTNVTNLSACDIGGNSWLNVFDAATGGEVAGSPYRAGRYMPGSITVGISLIRTQLGRILTTITKSDDTQEVQQVQTQQAAPLGRRSGWRDLLQK